MLANTAAYECVRCGAKNSETFQRKTTTGRRCLACGHTKFDQKTQYNDKAIWSLNNKESVKF